MTGARPDWRELLWLIRPIAPRQCHGGVHIWLEDTGLRQFAVAGILPAEHLTTAMISAAEAAI